MASKDIIQGLFETAVEYYSREAVNKALDFIATLSEEDLREWTQGMSPDDSARAYRVWRAARGVSETSIATVAP